MSRSLVAASTQYLYSTGASPVSGPPVTMSVWFNPTTSHNGTLIDLTHATSNHRVAITTDAAGTVTCWSAGTASGSQATSSGTYSTGAWNHVVGVISGDASRTISLNGATAISDTVSVTTTGCGRFYVGSLFANGVHTTGYYYNGLVAHVAVWNAALTTDEQAALAAGVSPLLVRPTALVSYMPMLGRGSYEEDWVHPTIVGLANSSTTVSQDNPRLIHPPGQSIYGSLEPAVSDSINIDTPATYRIHQRSGTTGTITVTGTYTGSVGPTHIEARLVQDGTSTPLTSFDWAEKVTTPSAGTYSFSFTGVPQGGWYNVQVRWSNDTAVNATSGKVGVGALVGIVGQSSAWLWFRDRATATSPNALVSVCGNISSWAAPDNAEMAGAIGFGNALATTLGVPVGVLDYAYDGSGLYSGGTAQWLPVSSTANRTFTDGVGALDDKLEAAVWIQGESDSGAGVSEANYYNSLGTLFADWRTQFSQASLPVVLATLAWRTSGGISDANTMNVVNAQIHKCGDSNVYRVDRRDIGMDVDGLHHSAAGYEALGARCALAVAYASGAVSQYRGPSIASATWAGAALVDVNLTHHAGTDFTPTSSITGFRVLVSGSPVTVNSVARQSASQIRITLAATPGSAPVIQYLYGSAPTVTGIVLDNNTPSLPLEGTNTTGITATAATTYTATVSGGFTLAGAASTSWTAGWTASATVTLVNESGTPQTGLSSLKWCWFDEVTPNLFNAPTDQGSTETTDGSGVLTVSLPNSAKTAGQVGWLIVTNSDGSTTQSPAHKAFSGPVSVA
jgi:hypothetical protein